MKVDAVSELRARLAGDQPSHGLWVALRDTAVTEAAVGLGLDWVVVDAEHGSLDWADISHHVLATARSKTCCIVRVSSSACIDLPGAAAQVKRALDIGADGVMIPNVETADQLRTLVGYARYPTAGVRGIGADRATAWGEAIPEHAANCARVPPLVVGLLESFRAYQNRAALAAAGDFFYLGPADYSATKGFAGQWEAPGAAEELKSMAEAIRAEGKPVGVMCSSVQDMAARAGQGFNMLGIGFDMGLMLRSAHSMLHAAGRDCKLNSSVTPPAPSLETAQSRRFEVDRSEELKLLFMGAGAVGGYTAGMLARAGFNVTCVDQYIEHVERINQSGLRVATPEGNYTVAAVKALHLHQLQQLPRAAYHCIFIAVKSYDTEWVTQMALPYLHPSGAFISLQNGINDHRMAAQIPNGSKHALGAVVTAAVGCLAAGKVERWDSNPQCYAFGEHDGADSPRIRQLVGLFDKAGVGGAKLSFNLWGARWSKLALNCFINVMAGLTGLSSQGVRTGSTTVPMGTLMAAETIRVAQAKQVAVEPLMGIAPEMFLEAASGGALAPLVTALRQQAKWNENGKASFLQDVIKGRRTEIEYLNKLVVDEAARLGIDTPFCKAATEWVLANEGFNPDPVNVQAVSELLPAVQREQLRRLTAQVAGMEDHSRAAEPEPKPPTYSFQVAGRIL